MSEKNRQAKLITIEKLENLNNRRKSTIKEVNRTIDFLKEKDGHKMAIEMLEEDVRYLNERISKTGYRIKKHKESLKKPANKQLK